MYEQPTEILELTEIVNNNDNIENLENHSKTPPDPEALESNNISNGELASPDDAVEVEQMAVVNAEVILSSPSLESRKKSEQLSTERTDDEKIIAEILKPEERMRPSKNSEKLSKVAKNTEPATVSSQE